MDLSQLRTFVAVAQWSSFSTAAAELHLSQPAISKRIGNLEMQLGTRLFDRIAREVRLTEPGRVLLARAEAILREVQDTETLVRNLTGDVSGSLSIATSHHVGLHRLPPVLRAFSDRHPQVHLDLDFLDSEPAHDLVLHGDSELGVVTLAPAGHPRLAYEVLWPDPLCFVVARDHPLASREHGSLREFCLHPVVLPGMSTYTGRIIVALFEQRGLELEVSMSTNYLETIRMLVSVGLGWSVLPETMVDETLATIPVPEAKGLERTLGVVVHPDRTLSNAANAFLEVLRECV
jgi:DNA-binding transcriptional LysR family regulator